MALFNGLPLLEAKINMEDLESGMYCISLVDAPATQSNFIAFSEDKELLKYSVQDEEQRRVFGLVMAADMPIYRRTAEGAEYYIVYSRQTLADMMEKYFKNGFQNQVDTNHNFEMEDGITLTQMFVKDVEKGVNPKGFEEYADGSIFAEFHIMNDEVWNAIKDGTYKGFSLAGCFTVEETFNKQQNNNKSIMKLEKIKTILRSLLVEVEMGEVATDKGVLVWSGEEDLKAGDAVKMLDTEAQSEVDAEDGEYRTEDKKVIIVKDGKVEEIKDDEAEVAVEQPIEEQPKAEEAAEEMPIDVEPKTEDERDLRISQLEAEIAEKTAEIDEKTAEIEALKARIAELENEPADKSAEQKFAETVEVEDNTLRGKMAKRGYKF